LHHIEVGPSLFRGRSEAVEDQRAHPALEQLEIRFDSKSRKAATEINRAIAPGRRPLEAQVAFAPGCEAPELAARMLTLSDRIGAEYLAIADSPHACGGYPLYAAGLFDAFRLHAERWVKSLAGYARVVMHCPACAWLYKSEVTRFGVPVPFTVEHSVEFLEGFAERLPIQKRQEQAFYHDPCYLGRAQGLYDPPRRLAKKAIANLREFSRTRQQAECCGGGGLLPVTMPDTAEQIAAHRLEEVHEANGNRIVTACSTCRGRLTQKGVIAEDLIEVLVRATDGEMR
jgi:Fe-S oxidoreductase